MHKKIKTDEEKINEIERIKAEFNRKIDRILFEYDKKIQEVVDHNKLRKIRDNF